MMQVRQFTSEDAVYTEALELRQRYLREPLGLTLTEDDLFEERQQLHFGIFDEANLLGSVSFKVLDQVSLKLRQMVICQQAQGTGCGAKLVNGAEEVVRGMGYRYVEMAARASARGFYEKLGYLAEGDTFLELGIEHLKMSKQL